MSTLYEKVVREQAEERKLFRSGAFIKRDAEHFFATKSKLIQIIMGIRRSGKSTLGHLAINNKDYAYLNFDDERLIAITDKELDKLLEALYSVYGDFTYLFLDEIQNIDNWSLFINRLYRQGIQITITGSNSKLLSKELATHLTGRYRSLELLPFSFKEYTNYKKFKYTNTTKSNGLLLKHLNDYMQHGGFPEVLQGNATEQYVRDLVNAIINRDIIDRYVIKYTTALRQIAYFLIDNFSRELSYNRIKNQLKLKSEHTVKNYVNYLEEAYLIFTVSKFSYKKMEQLKYRKLYVPDPSFATVLTNAPAIDRGFLLENIVFLELYRRKAASNSDIFYYKQNEEVDFVITRNAKVWELIQVCYDLNSEKTFNREVKALLNVSKALKSKKLTIITYNDERTLQVDGKTIQIIPVGKWLLNLNA